MALVPVGASEKLAPRRHGRYVEDPRSSWLAGVNTARTLDRAAPQRGYAVQKLLPVRGGLNAYLAAPRMLVDERTQKFPFCDSPHHLRLHGMYDRWVLVEDGQEAKLPVQRLLCAHTGKTVSLLPDFAIPRRQHGPVILGTFLAGYASGRPLVVAFRAARPGAQGHSVAQSLLKGFLSRAGPIRAYLARLRARAVETPPSATGPRREVGALLVVAVMFSSSLSCWSSTVAARLPRLGPYIGSNGSVIVRVR